MVIRFALLLTGLFVVALVGAFMLYVSVLSILAAVAITLGVLATLFLGFWAGSYSPEPPPKLGQRRRVPAINAPRDVEFVQEAPASVAPVSQIRSWKAAA